MMEELLNQEIKILQLSLKKKDTIGLKRICINRKDMTELQKYPVAESLINAANKISSSDGLWDGRDNAFHTFMSAGFPNKNGKMAQHRFKWLFEQFIYIH